MCKPYTRLVQFNGSSKLYNKNMTVILFISRSHNGFYSCPWANCPTHIIIRTVQTCRGMVISHRSAQTEILNHNILCRTDQSQQLLAYFRDKNRLTKDFWYSLHSI